MKEEQVLKTRPVWGSALYDGVVKEEIYVREQIKKMIRLYMLLTY